MRYNRTLRCARWGKWLILLCCFACVRVGRAGARGSQLVSLWWASLRATTSLFLKVHCLLVEVLSCGGSLLFEVLIQTRSQVHEEGVSLEEDSVTSARHNSSDLTSSLDPSQLEESWRCGEGGTKELGSLGLTLSLDNGGFLVLEGLVDEELWSLSILLCNLFLFNGLGELGSEMQVRDGHIIEHDIEVLASFSETVSNLLWNLLSLSEQLSSVVSGDNRLEHLVDNWGEDTTIVILTQESVKIMELLRVRAEQDSQWDVDHLQIYSLTRAKIKIIIGWLPPEKESWVCLLTYL